MKNSDNNNQGRQSTKGLTSQSLIMKHLRRYMGVLSILSIVCSSSIFSAYAKPENLPNQTPPTQNYNFEGVVKLNKCSGSLIRFENSKDSDAAMILTNGHCLGYLSDWRPNLDRYIYKTDNTDRFKLMNSSAEFVGELQADQVIYSTMKRTDMTLYRINMSFAEILTKYGVHALTLSSKHPEANTPIEIISGFWGHGYSCQIEAFIPHLQEEKWTFDDSIRYSRPGCETIGGDSGSPVIQKGTRTVIGIGNTYNLSGEKCTLNNPCEIDDKGNITFQRGYQYAQQTYEIYSCLNSNNEFDLAVAGCKLPHEEK